MKLILLHDVDGRNTQGQVAFTAAAEHAGLEVLAPTRPGGWWPGESFNEWAATELPVDTDEVRGLVGIGSGGQAALRSAYAAGRSWPVVAAIAPACDLGRWFGRKTEIDELYANVDAARQDEAPLFFNPLNRPAKQLCWCDPRDEACLPSSLRVVSKAESSGVAIEADLETEAGDDRDSYLEQRAHALVDWLADAANRVPLAVDLPILPR